MLGDTLSSTHDLDRILQVILQTARHATGAASGVVLLADDSGMLVGKCAEGTTVDVKVGRRGGPGRLGRGDGCPQDGADRRDGPRLEEGEPDLRHLCRGAVLHRGTGGGGRAGRCPPREGCWRSTTGTGGRVRRSRPGHAADIRRAGGSGRGQRRVHEEAQRLSVTDSLTGLFNHRSLRDVLRETERAGRFGRRLAVLVLDLDHFKEINDRYGHAAGDAVLVEFAQRLSHEIREVDVAFRQGGEEFALLLPETDEVGGIAVAERLCEALRRVPDQLIDGNGNVTVTVTVSIGVAVLPDHGQTGPAVLRAADEALYAAKTAGRDTFRVAGETRLRGREHGLAARRAAHRRRGRPRAVSLAACRSTPPYVLLRL